MRSLRGRLVATIFVIRFFPQNLFGKFVGKMVGNVGWKIGWKIGWKCWLEMLVGKCWVEKWLEKLLVNGCEIIGGKIVATNLPLRLLTTDTLMGSQQGSWSIHWLPKRLMFDRVF